MKKIYLLVAWSAITLYGYAQNLTLADQTKVKRCATVEVIEGLRQQNPNMESDAHFEAWMNNLIQQRRQNEGNRLNFANYNLPIVFHIIHNGNAVGNTYNVAQSKIIQQVLQLNKDYANQSNSPYAVSANTGIKFSLAQKNESGANLTEPGIDRIDRNDPTYNFTDPTTAAGWTTSYINAFVKPNTIWDPTRYINIWLVPSMPQGGGEILGYATFPGSSTLPGLDNGETASTAGVVLKYSVVGSVFEPFSSCAESFGQGKTLTHELGHFFGLRHIWGDGTCATDYVDDTPVHFASNSGVPQHPKSNTCGTLDEMFENYMDYTDDRILNTFTQNQVDRMQTVMLNSPRRVSLATSTVGLIAPSATNRISFNDCLGGTTVSETATLGTYPRYKDVRFYMNVDGAATGAATVNFTNSGTAVLGRDFTLTSNSVTFAAGETYKPVTIRIVDNATVDGDRTIVLNYTISGTGVTAGTTAQSVTVTILDDDNISIGQNLVNVFTENFENGLTTNIFGLPAGWNILLTGGYPNRFVTSANGDAGGSGKAAHITNDWTGTRPNTYTKGVSGALVLQSPLIDPSRYVSLGSFSFKYKVGGRSTDYANATFNYAGINTFYLLGATAGASGYGPYYSTSATPASGNPSIAIGNAISGKFNFDFYWQTGTSAAGFDPGFNVDDVILTAQPFTIETAVSNSYSYDVYTGTNSNFRSLNSKAILSLSGTGANTTSVTAAVTEAGTDRPTFSTNGVTYMRSRKVISLSANPAFTANHTVKLYYTVAELAAWGTSVSGLKVMKVNSGVSLSSDLNSGNALIVTPTLFEDSSATRGYYAFTATFAGAGQYVVVANNAVLPVKLLSFTGSLEKNKSKLNWKTANEINNKGFEVERSIDGTKYEKIDFVSASATNNYELFDATIIKGNKYYYRLKQIDIDGNYTYSPLVIVNYFGENGIFVFPNPVKNNLIVQQGSLGRTSVVVTDLAGKTVYTTTFSAGTLSIDAQTWSNGVYMVRVIKNGETSNFKIMKQ